MSELGVVLQNPFWARVGWALAAFLWQGTLAALLLAGANAILRGPRARYAAACAALLVMLACPIATFLSDGPDLTPAAAAPALRRAADPAPALSTRAAAPSPASTLVAALKTRTAELAPRAAPVWAAGVLLLSRGSSEADGRAPPDAPPRLPASRRVEETLARLSSRGSAAGALPIRGRLRSDRARYRSARDSPAASALTGLTAKRRSRPPTSSPTPGAATTPSTCCRPRRDLPYHPRCGDRAASGIERENRCDDIAVEDRDAAPSPRPGRPRGDPPRVAAARRRGERRDPSPAHRAAAAFRIPCRRRLPVGRRRARGPRARDLRRGLAGARSGHRVGSRPRRRRRADPRDRRRAGRDGFRVSQSRGRPRRDSRRREGRRRANVAGGIPGGVRPALAGQAATPSPDPSPESGRPLSPDELTELRHHGVDAEFLGALASLGYKKAGLDELIALKVHGVAPEYISAMNGLFNRQLSLDELTALRSTARLARIREGRRDAGYAPRRPRSRPHPRRDARDGLEWAKPGRQAS